MRFDKDSLLLYAVTDRAWLGDNSLADQVEEAIKAGATFIQLREKDMGFEEFCAEAAAIKKITDKYNVPFVINDNIEVALKVNADGVHVGQTDMAAKDVRKLIGYDKILGVSTQTLEQSKAAQASGADYVGVGAVFSTSTKLNAENVPFETLYDICNNISIPVVAIGGISKDNILKLKGSGIAGVAVVSAIFAQPDIYKATANLRKLCEELK